MRLEAIISWQIVFRKSARHWVSLGQEVGGSSYLASS